MLKARQRVRKRNSGEKWNFQKIVLRPSPDFSAEGSFHRKSLQLLKFKKNFLPNQKWWYFSLWMTTIQVDAKFLCNLFIWAYDKYYERRRNVTEYISFWEKSTSHLLDITSSLEGNKTSPSVVHLRQILNLFFISFGTTSAGVAKIP